MDSKDSVLIIEDSQAVGMLLSGFMKKLGYVDVQTAESGKEGLSKFTKLIEQNIIPLIFLDYNLPDTTAKSIMSHILSIKPYTKIILETANDKSDDVIKEAIGNGAYDYIQKPLRFEDIKEIVSILEKEKSILDTTSDINSSNLHETNDQETTDHINFILKSTKQISLKHLVQILGFSNTFVVEYLQELEDTGKIIRLNERQEITCNQCDSVRALQLFSCSSCKNSHFKLGKMIEHYDCGNITEENTYLDDLCPNCNKEIKILGVDHRVMSDHYICSSCNEFSPTLHMEYICLKCESKFKLEDASWTTSIFYKISNM